MQMLETLSNLAKRNQLFPLLIKSFCPSIYGHELVKAGLILGMLGGSSKVLKNSVNAPNKENKKAKTASFRSNCHV
jgi:DNA replicative helicase MCM subunit Mcm2 (Cdc46/Mcm family)